MSYQSLKDRWVNAMCAIPYSLIGVKGYTLEDAEHVCRLFRESAPSRPSKDIVLALEREVTNISRSDTVEPANPPSQSIRIPARQSQVQRIRKPIKQNPDDYPTPWCKVIKDGVIIRYEDATGQLIPDILWRKSIR